MRTFKHVTIYTDGGCDPNPGPGGYGVVILLGALRKELSGGFRLTTNNRMEIYAAIRGLEALAEPSQVTLYSDSSYLVDAMTKGWAARWKEQGWMRNSKEPALNPDLWERLLALCEKHQVKFVWLRGHAGDPWNERCDQLSARALLRKDLPADAGYEGKPESLPSLKITKEGQPCRKCGTPVVKRRPSQKPKADQQYAYDYYLFCPQCKTIYLVEEAKKPLPRTPRLL